MTAADRDAIISLHRQSIFGLCRGSYTETEMKAWTGRLTPELFDEGVKDSNNVGIVAVEANVVVGYGFFTVHERELRALYVLPEHAGRGIGRHILSRLEIMAREEGIDRLSLQSTINAVGFYEKSGYRAIREERHLISDKISVTCVRMEKELHPAPFAE